MGGVGAVDIQSTATGPDLVSEGMVLERVWTQTHLEGANDSSGVNVEDVHHRRVLLGGGPDVLFSVRNHVVETAFSSAVGSIVTLGFLADGLRGNVLELGGSIGGKYVDAGASEGPQGVSNVVLLEGVVLFDSGSKSCSNMEKKEKKIASV